MYSVYAQQQQKTVSYSRDLTLGTVIGEASYPYITREDGINVPDGNATVKAKGHREISGFLYHGAVDITYSMNASYSKGLLNGPLSSVCKVKLTYNSEQFNEQCTFSGYFRNGIPDGHFKVYSDITNENGEYDLFGSIKLEANYTKGILSGPYEYSGPDNLGRNTVATTVKGQFDSKGRPTGKWKVFRLGNMDYEFLNGVMVYKSTESYSTTTYQKEVSMKYAKGELTREEVNNMGFVIKTDSLSVGNYARIAIIYSRDGFDFSYFKGYDFTIENNPHYEYLVETPVLNTEGADYLADAIKKWLVSNLYDDELYVALGYASEYNLYGYILTDNGEYKIKANKKSGFTKYLKNPAAAASKSGFFDVYISPEEMNYIDSTMNAFFESESVSLTEYFFGSENATAKSVIDAIKNRSSDGMQYFTSLSEYANTIIRFRENVRFYKLSDKYSYLKTNDRERNKTIITMSSLGNFDSLANETYSMCKSEIAKYFLEKSFNFIVENKKAFNIVWCPKDDYSPTYFYSKDNDPYWQTNLEKRLKPFGNIKGYEIVSIDTQNHTVTCNLKRSGKKKKDPEIISQITLEFRAYGDEMAAYSIYQLCVESFDITKARQL